jgi:hypothetical protein
MSDAVEQALESYRFWKNYCRENTMLQYMEFLVEEQIYIKELEDRTYDAATDRKRLKEISGSG